MRLEQSTQITTILLITFLAAALIGGALFLGNAFNSAIQTTPTPTAIPEPTEEVTGTPSTTETPEATGTPATLQPNPATEQTPVAAKWTGLLQLHAQTNDEVRLGVIEAIFIDVISGRVTYLVFKPSPEGAQAFPVAVPWQAVSGFSAADALALLDVDLATLQAAPAVDPQQFGELLTDPAWDEGVRSYWSGSTSLPAQATPPTQEQAVASLGQTLVGVQVQTTDGTEIGEVRGFLVDLATGDLAYIVVSLDGDAVAIPWQRVAQVETGPDIVLLNVGIQAVDAAPRVRLDDWPDLIIDPSWDAPIGDYWSSVAD